MNDLDTLSEAQKAAYLDILAGHNTNITGGAGTGKSRTARVAIDALILKNKRVAVTASTGMAAVNMGGCTIHSFLKTGLCGSVKELKAKFSPESLSMALDRMATTDTIVIDEPSMLTGDYFDMVDWWLRLISKNLNGEERGPFGGWQIITTGDFLQLPPVIVDRTPKVLYAFQSKAWKNAGFRNHYLRRSFRQEDPEFYKHLRRLRVGKLPQSTADYFNARVSDIVEDDINQLYLYPKNETAARRNMKVFNSLKSPIYEYDAEYTGHESWVEALQKVMPCRNCLEVRDGMPVIFVKNSTQNGFVNGSRGVIVNASGARFQVNLFDGGVIDVPKMTFNLTDGGGTILATAKQFPVVHGAAVSVHKSQGQTLDSAVFDPSETFDFGQAYVALSRVRSIQGLTLENKLSFRHVKAAEPCLEYYRELLAKTR